MNWGKVFAWGIITLSLIAAVGYALQRDWRRSFYWLFSACIAIDVTV